MNCHWRRRRAIPAAIAAMVGIVCGAWLVDPLTIAIAILLAALVAIAYRRPLPFGAHTYLMLDTATVLSAALLLPWPMAGLVAFVGPVAAAVAGSSRSEGLFNGGQEALQAIAACAVLWASGFDRSAPFADMRVVIAIPVAGLAMHLVNTAAVAAAVAIQVRERFLPRWRQIIWFDRTEAAAQAAQWGLALLALIIVDGHPWGILFLVLPGILVYGTLERHGRLRVRAEEQLVHQAFHDPLTGLPNRAQLTSRLDEALDRAKAAGSLVAVLFLDLDKFKQVNDSLGHEAGDVLLKEIAARLRDCLDHGETVARLGGDEFVVVIESVSARDDVAPAITTIRRAIAKPVTIGGVTVVVTASVGVAFGGNDHRTGAELLREADVDLYEAKEQGKAPVSRVEVDLRRAIERNEIEIGFEPDLDPITARVVAMTARPHWRPAHCGRLEAAELLAIAEENGLAAVVRRHVLHRACRRAAYWQTTVRMPFPLVIALPGDDLLPLDVEAVLFDTGLESYRLRIHLIGDSSAHIGARLRALGVLVEDRTPAPIRPLEPPAQTATDGARSRVAISAAIAAR